MTDFDLALCYGTRPQVIKASVVRRALGEAGRVLAVDTGQHYDYSLNALLYQQLGVAPADICLDVGSAPHAEQTAAVLVRAAAVFQEHSPRAVVVIGDTNSTLGCALAAAKLRIPVVHIEAGLRAADAHMAEELNRRVVDAVASVLCTPSAAATARMRREHPDADVAETGDVAFDVLRAQVDHLPNVRHLLPPGADGGYAFATLHRAELTDQPELLDGVLAALSALPLPTLLAIHPRTQAALDLRGRGTLRDGRLRAVPAVGYLESLALTRGARIVVTDSGGLQREAYWLGVPCVTIRSETEWLETLALGANRLVAPVEAPIELSRAVAARLDQPRDWSRDAYGTGNAAPAIAAATMRLLDRISATAGSVS